MSGVVGAESGTIRHFTDTDGGFLMKPRLVTMPAGLVTTPAGLVTMPASLVTAPAAWLPRRPPGYHAARLVTTPPAWLREY